jgi:hypothetical protein
VRRSLNGSIGIAVFPSVSPSVMTTGGFPLGQEFQRGHSATTGDGDDRIANSFIIDAVW